MTTMATMDWAMQALGISNAPAGSRKAPACAVGLDGGSIDAEIIVIEANPTNTLIRFDGVAPSTPGSCPTTVVEAATIVHVDAAIDRLATASATSRSAVINAVHGVTHAGDWFLLADLGAAVACREPPAGDIITTSARDG